MVPFPVMGFGLPRAVLTPSQLTCCRLSLFLRLDGTPGFCCAVVHQKASPGLYLDMRMEQYGILTIIITAAGKSSCPRSHNGLFQARCKESVLLIAKCM